MWGQPPSAVPRAEGPMPVHLDNWETKNSRASLDRTAEAAVPTYPPRKAAVTFWGEGPFQTRGGMMVVWMIPQE